MMEPVTWKPRGTAESKKPQCGANEEERHSRQSETKPYGSRQSESHEAMESASPMTTATSRRRSGWSSGAKRRMSWTSERRSERSDSCHPHGGLARPKRAFRMSTEQSPEVVGDRHRSEVNGKKVVCLWASRMVRPPLSP